jgi:hypothetical protein
MNVRDLVSLKSFDPVINLNWAGKINEQERLLSNYIMTEDLAEIFVDMLESITLTRSKSRREKLSGDIDLSVTKRSHILSGQYGTGKSYFLLMLNIVLEMKNTSLTNMIIERFSEYSELQYQLKYIRENKKYFLVRINGENENQKEFKDVIQADVIAALEKEFGEVNISSVYKKTLSMFMEIYEKNEERMDEVLLSKNYSKDDIRAGLSNYRKEGIRQAEEVLREAFGFIPKIELDKLEDFLIDANGILKENGYDELVIIFDEFSAYLTASIEDKRVNKDLGQIQNIAQLSANSSNLNISFIASTHKDLAEMIENSGVSKKEDLDKVFGRFSVHQLVYGQEEEFLKNTLRLDEKGFYQYRATYGDMFDELEREYGRRVEDFYPLHPATVMYLEPMTTMYAQRVRTTFGFLEEKVKKDFFTQKVIKDGKLNLVTVSDLYDYFEKDIEDKKRDLYGTFNQIYNQVKTDPDLVDFSKALAVAYSSSLTATGAITELSPKNLMYMYQIESENEVEKKMDPLVADIHVNIIKNNDKYRFSVNNSGIDIDKLVRKEKEEINPNIMMRKILDKSEDRIFIKNDYNLKYNMGLYPMDRNLDGFIYSLEELKELNFETSFSTSKDGKIIFMIPRFEEDYNLKELTREYMEKMKDLDKNICLAIPKEIMFDGDNLREYGALLHIEKSNEEVAKNEEVKKIIVIRRKKLEDKIRNKYLRKFSNLKNFTFIFSEGKVRNDLRQDKALYKEILYSHYNKFPSEIKVENFNQRGPLNKLIKLFLDGGRTEITKKNKTSEEAKNIYATLKPLDLVKITEHVNTEKVEFKAPSIDTSELSKEIMDIVELPEEKMSLRDKYNTLTSTPYGLNTMLVDLYFFVSNKLGRTYIQNKKTGRMLPLDDTSIKSLTDKAEEYEMEKNEIIDIPSETKMVWVSFGKIKGIRTSGNKVKLNGKNDFNVSMTLAKEMNDIYERILDREHTLSIYGVNTGRLKTLINKIKSASMKFKPGELFEEVGKIPNIFRKSSFNENLEELDNFILDLNNVDKDVVNKISQISQNLGSLDYKIRDLEKYSDFKEELKKQQRDYKSYLENFLNVELLDKVFEETKKLMKSYIEEFKKKHDEYYEEYDKQRNDLMISIKDKVECVKSLEELKFENIASMQEFFLKLDRFEICDCVVGDEHFECICPYDELKKLENAIPKLEDEFKKKKSQISGVFERYVDELISIKDQFEYNTNYKNLIFSLRSIQGGNTEKAKEIPGAVEAVKDEINKYLENINIIPVKTVEFEELAKVLVQEMLAIGKKNVNFEELKIKFEQVVKEYKEREYQIIKLT